MEPHTGDRAVNDDLAEVADVEVNRVEEEEVLHKGAERINGIKDSRYIHEKLREYRPQILHVSEKDEQSGKDQTHTNIKQKQGNDRD